MQQQSRLFMQSKSNVIFLGCCVAFLHSVKKHNGKKKKIVVKRKFGKKNPRVGIMCSHIKMWKAEQNVRDE